MPACGPDIQYWQYNEQNEFCELGLLTTDTQDKIREGGKVIFRFHFQPWRGVCVAGEEVE